jgi:hypothetical protein
MESRTFANLRLGPNTATVFVVDELHAGQAQAVTGVFV